MRTEKFNKLHATLVTDKANEVAKSAGAYAVKALYSNDDAEMCYALLNDTPQFMRKAFATWFRSYGISITNPLPGQTDYTGVVVKDKKVQAKMFTKLNADDAPDVFAQEIKAVKVKKPKELLGSAKDRAAKRMEAVIKAVRKDDPETASYIGKTWAMKVEETVLTFDDGAEFELNKAEECAVRRFILEMRGMLKKAA